MALGVLALGQALDSLTLILGLESGSTLETIRRALAGASPAMLGLAVGGIGVLAGFCEGGVLPRFMQTRLRQRWLRLGRSLAAALGFGILHLDRVHSTLASSSASTSAGSPSGAGARCQRWPATS